MRRHTPILAILFAPVVLFALLSLWKSALVPLYISFWRSNTVLEMRIASDNPSWRVAALNQAMGVRPADEQLIALIFATMRTDPDRSVRAAAVNALGQIGARQALPAEVTDALVELMMKPEDGISLPVVMQAVAYSSAHHRYPDEVVIWITGALDEPRTDWERAEAAQGLAKMAEHRSLPGATLERLAVALQDDPSAQVRQQAVQALSRSAGVYPPAEALLAAAKNDPSPEVRSAAEVGLRLLAHDREFAGREPLALLMDASQPVERRLVALRIIRSTRIEQAAYEDLASLVRDADTRIVIAALEIFHYLARSPGDAFDRRVLIPELTRTMSHPDPKVREAAVGAVSRIAIHRPEYASRATELQAALEAGATDPAPQVRVVALAAMMRGNPGRSERAAILERGLTDADPYVRRQIVGWLGSPRGRYPDRDAWLERMVKDPDPDVRKIALMAEQEWRARKRAWPIELWHLVRAGEYEQVAMSGLIAITVAAPVLIGGIFLIYYMARLLTYSVRRSWRAAAALVVIGVWIAAGYGMFFLYFAAGNAGLTDRGDLLLAAAILWGVIVMYAGLGWGMHYAIRR